MRIVFALFALLLVSCSALKASHPQGFAVYEQSLGEQSLRTISPEGVTWKVSVVKQDEVTSLEYWKEAVKRRLTEGGYRIVDSLNVNNPVNVFAWESMAPIGKEVYVYMVSARIEGDQIRVSEASGLYKDYQTHKKAIFDAVQK